MDIYVRENSLFIASVSDDKTCQIYRVRVYRVCQTNEWGTTLAMNRLASHLPLYSGSNLYAFMCLPFFSISATLFNSPSSTPRGAPGHKCINSSNFRYSCSFSSLITRVRIEPYSSRTLCSHYRCHRLQHRLPLALLLHLTLLGQVQIALR